MSMAIKYMQATDNMANSLIAVMADSENIPIDIFMQAANLIDKWRDSVIELIFLTENGTCLEFDVLLDKYEAQLNECLFYANNYEKEV